MFLQIIGAGIIGCVVEELSMRGVSYLHTKHYYGKKRAIFINAFIFGLYHLNVVQAVYAFFLGLFFAWVFERYQTLWAPVIAHMSANLFIILLSECQFFNHMLTTMVGFCLITCICVMVFFYGWRFMNMTDPVVELEFVEKEPDTLKKLTAEYNALAILAVTFTGVVNLYFLAKPLNLLRGLTFAGSLVLCAFVFCLPLTANIVVSGWSDLQFSFTGSCEAVKG